MVAPPLLQRGDILLFLKWETTRGLPLPPPSKIYRRQLCQGFFSFCNGIFNMSLAGMMTMLERNFMFFLGKQILLKSCARFPRKVTKVNWRKKQCLLSTQQFFLSCSPSAVFFYADNFLLPEMRDKRKEE